LPEAAKADHLIDALRRHGVLSTGRVRDVTTDAPHGAFISCARNRHGMAKTAVLQGRYREASGCFEAKEQSVRRFRWRVCTTLKGDCNLAETHGS
jgi:hypothetical protein